MATNEEDTQKLPDIPKKSVYQFIRDVRKRNCIQINSETNLCGSILTLRCKNFCLYDSGSEDCERIIVFSTEDNLSHLKHSKFWVCDGTFKVVPREFTQLYTIHGHVFNKVLPFVFILMSNKSERSYERAIQIIKEKGNLELPPNIIIDFEMAAFNAFEKESKHSVSFCLFNLGQRVFRKSQKLGLSKLYQQNNDFRLFVKCVTSLAFVPSDFVNVEWEKLLNEAQKLNIKDLNLFFIYVEKNFIKSNKYPIESWNAYSRTLNDIPLTSNNAESFHRHFYNRFDQAHSGLLTFIENLKGRQSTVEQEAMFYLCNL